MYIEAVMELAPNILRKEDDSEETRRPKTRVSTAVHADEDMDILQDMEYVAAVLTERTRCAAVQKRDDITRRRREYDLMRRTNVEQHEIPREIIHRATTPDPKLFWVFLTGPAGCGKMYVLRLIMDMCNRYYNAASDSSCSSNAYVVCTSTGKAAVALGGTTVHAAFKLMRHNDGGFRDSDLNTFRTAFANVKCAIIDEVSMLFPDTFDRIDSRLRRMTYKYDVPFGKLDVVMCDDLKQLPPFRASKVFKHANEHNKIFNSEVK
ncbi:helicase, putative [Ixodes scapularis]|uniref:ATP-dependent DNA helicase n=1 Tax=Ixodes scapularis TaxID=6945 RepID=B7PLQ5_IXOSC|nr:helicase, putative [Ixodes scapularis]|eukprot:XP_002434703.1 helicase, putative [Ixodes scapularis]